MNYFVFSYVVIISDISSDEGKSKENLLGTKLTGKKINSRQPLLEWQREVNYKSGKDTHIKQKIKHLNDNEL